MYSKSLQKVSEEKDRLKIIGVLLVVVLLLSVVTTLMISPVRAQEYDVNVIAPPDAVETEYGNYTYNYTVENIGTENNTYDLEVTSSNLANFVPSAPAQVTVETNTSEEVTVTVEIVDAPSGSFADITLTAESQNNTVPPPRPPSDSDDMRVTYQLYDVNVTAPPDAVETEYGNYTYNYTVENTGVENDTYDLEVTTTNNNFSPSAPVNVSLDANTSENVSVVVQIDGAQPGEWADITLTATSQNATLEVTDSDTMRVTYRDFDVEVTAPEDAVETGYGNYTYSFTVDNTGTQNDTYDLNAASSNLDWTASTLDNISIPAGDNISVPVTVTIPETAVDGDFSDITLTATSQNNTVVTDWDDMTVTYRSSSYYAVNVTAPEDQAEPKPGDYTYEFTVNNTGTEDDTYNLTATSSNPDWSATSDPDNISLAAGEDAAVSVVVTIWGNSEPGDSSVITLTAVSRNDTGVENSDNMTVTYTRNLDVEVTAPGDQTESEDGVYTYNFTVANVGNDPDTYNLTVDSSNPDWGVNAPEQVTVIAKDEEIIAVEVTIPQSASNGDISDITLTATSQNMSEVSDSDSMTVMYTAGLDVNVIAPQDQTESEPGPHSYDFTVENIGTENDTYDLTVESSNNNWTATAPDQVSVEAGTNETVAVEVTIPIGAADGEQSRINLTATSQNNTAVNSSDWMRVTYNAPITGDVNVIAPGDQTETRIGTYSYSFTVQNLGDANDTYDLTVTTSNPDWEASAPSQISIEAGSNESVLVDVTIPGSAQDGDTSDITLTVTSQNETTVTDMDSMTVTFEPERDVIVTALGDQTEKDTGNHTYSFVVENNGTIEDTYDLTVETSTQNWTADVIGQVTIAAGTVETVDVTVNIPENAGYGDSSDITLTATSQNDTGVTDSGVMTLTYMSHTLTVQDPDHGTIYVEGAAVTETQESFVYSAGELVDIEAVGDENYHFLEWIGDNETIVDTKSNGTSVTMDDNYTITAEFTTEPEVARVTIDPSENQTITAGDEIDFSAEAYDENDNLITDTDTDFDWQNTDETGLFDETETSEYEVTATYDGVDSETVLVTVEPAEADHIEISPQESTIDADESEKFFATAYDEYGNEINVTDQTDWSIEEDDHGGSWDGNLYEAGDSGNWTVIGDYEGMMDEATLTVQETTDDTEEDEGSTSIGESSWAIGFIVALLVLLIALAFWLSSKEKKEEEEEPGEMEEEAGEEESSFVEEDSEDTASEEEMADESETEEPDTEEESGDETSEEVGEGTEE